jgi:multiple sugar transport system permease protein/raffinose/stachyose/melibiose transport system permease protein
MSEWSGRQRTGVAVELSPTGGRIFARLRSAFSRDEVPWIAVAAFLAPALIFYFAFTVYPIIRTFHNSLLLIRPRGTDEFVGLHNFATLAADPRFWTAVGNTAIWAIVAPALDVSIGLTLALCLYVGVPLSRFLRVAWFTPTLISYVVIAILWSWIYNYDWGIPNQLLRALGLPGWQRQWLGDPASATLSLIVVSAWKWAGMNMIVCLAALHGLPSEVLEASELDNCGWFQKIYFIVLPMIAPTIVGLFILDIVGKMMVFDLPWIMTGGGPLWSTETVSTYLYKRAFRWNTFDLGYPSAIAVVWFALILITTVGFRLLFRRRDKLEY